ncbi:MAG: hypothetical protein JWN86_4387 [Planctomycetota bacterium]|nr:hypothetical protein [Planctomycetota bacterium]
MIDRMSEMEAGFGSTADAAKERALDLAAAARERFALGSEAIKSYTLEQPARALGLALGMGVLLGWLIKRR